MVGPVATSAGSSGGAQHPHGHPQRSQAQCEGASDVPEIDEEEDDEAPTIGRGVAIGEKIIRLRNQLGHPIPLEWDKTNRTRKAVGDYGSMYYTGVGIYVRNYCEAWHNHFKDVPQSSIDKVFDDVKYHFQPVERDIVLQDAASRYRNWKNTITRRIKRLGPRAETSGKGKHCKTSMEWLECVKRFRTGAFQEISIRNTNNRKKVRYASLQGRTPQAQRRHESGNNDFEVFRQTHMNKDGEWISPLAAEDHNRMLEEAQRALSSTPGTSLTPEKEKEIMEKILGHRRGYTPGIGPSIPAPSFSQRSTVTSSSGQVSKEEHDATRRHLHDVSTALDTLLKWVKTALPDTPMPNINIPPPPPISGDDTSHDDGIDDDIDAHIDDL